MYDLRSIQDNFLTAVVLGATHSLPPLAIHLAQVLSNVTSHATASKHHLALPHLARLGTGQSTNGAVQNTYRYSVHTHLFAKSYRGPFSQIVN